MQSVKCEGFFYLIEIMDNSNVLRFSYFPMISISARQHIKTICTAVILINVHIYPNGEVMNFFPMPSKGQMAVAIKFPSVTCRLLIVWLLWPYHEKFIISLWPVADIFFFPSVHLCLN
jgi:hypothetical protein